MNFARRLRKLYRLTLGDQSCRLQKRLLSTPARSEQFVPLFSNVSSAKNHEIIGVANRILDGNYYFLGVSISACTIPQWHKDYLTGYVWPLLPHNKIRGETPDGVEIKNPWELSAFFHLLPVSVAYSLSKDSKYQDYFVQNIKKWVKDNPFLMGVNWSSPMFVAFRLVQIVEAYSSELGDGLCEDLCCEIEGIIWQHLIYLVNNLENLGSYHANHYVGNLVGLFWGSLFFSSKSLYVRYVNRFVINALSQEIAKQVQEGGMHFEGSTGYHRLVTELFLYSAILMQKNNQKPLKSLDKHLRKMLDALYCLTLPNGNLPLIGDYDDCRLFWGGNYFDSNRRDTAYLLNTGAVYFNVNRWLCGPQNAKELSGWIWGKDFDNKLSEEVATDNIITRSNWDEIDNIYLFRSNDVFLLINCIHPGIASGGHTHNDSLSFILWLDGNEIFVDPGTYVYTRDIETRNYFRSTSSHNVLMVDGEEQWPLPEKLPFLLEKKISPKVLYCKANDEGYALVGEHYGYLRLPGKIVHKRSFAWSSVRKALSIKDKLYCLSEGEIDQTLTVHCYFHLSPYVEVKSIADDYLSIVRKKDEVHLCSINWPNDGSVNVSVDKSWVSEGYGVKKPSEKIIFSFSNRLPLECEFRISKMTY